MVVGQLAAEIYCARKSSPPAQTLVSTCGAKLAAKPDASLTAGSTGPKSPRSPTAH